VRLPILLLAALVIACLAASVGFVYHRRQKQRRALENNEVQAQEALRSLQAAEENFRSNDADRNGVLDYWTGDVAGLHRYGLIPASLADADAAPLQTTSKPPVPFSGYYFIALDSLEPSGEIYRQDTDGKNGKVHHRSRFAFCAFPAHYGETGRYSWVMTQDQSTTVGRDVGGRPLQRYPDDLQRDPFPAPK
jgi:hypothetical protein